MARSRALQIEWRIFCFLMYKNLLARKRAWVIGFGLLAVPLFLFGPNLLKYKKMTEIKPNLTTFPQENVSQLLFDDISILEVHYAPKDMFPGKLMKYVQNCLNINADRIRGAHNEREVRFRLQNLDKREHVGIIFADSEVPKKLKYHILTKDAEELNIYNDEGNKLNTREVFTTGSFFLQVQYCVDTSFIKYIEDTKEITHTPVSLSIRRFPEAATLINRGLVGKSVVFMIMAVIFVQLYLEGKFIHDEKHSGIFLLLSICGIKLWKNQFYWLLHGMLYSVFYITVIVIFLSVADVIYVSNAYIIWIILFVHTAHSISFVHHLSSYLPKAYSALLLMTLLYFISTLIYLFSSYTNFYEVLPAFGLLFPNLLLYRAFEIFDVLEDQAVRIQWSNMYTSVDSYSSSIGTVLWYSIIGTFVQFLLTSYINKVIPGKYCVAKNIFYFMKYFIPNPIKERLYENLQYPPGGPFESVRETWEPSIKIRSLSKSYNCLPKHMNVNVLKDINLDICQDHITGFMGPRAIGKSTLISILSGMLSETSGDILLEGKPIKDVGRKDIGICFGKNILFPNLSVYEHILLFGLIKLKDKSWAEVSADAEDMVSKLNLSHKRNKHPSKLTAEEKRLVCIGMSIIGGSKILLLDDPTLGLSVESRKVVWNILSDMKDDRTIIITTSNMEEAEFCDKIAILEFGKVIAFASPAYLEDKYDVGNLEISFKLDQACDTDKIVQELGPESDVTFRDRANLIISVPFSIRVASALDKMEYAKADYRIFQLTVSYVTLPKVVERIMINSDNDRNRLVDYDLPQDTDVTTEKEKGSALYLQQLYASFRKKMLLTVRNKYVYFMLMILCVIGSLILVKFDTLPKVERNAVKTMDLSLYPYPRTFIGSTHETATSKIQNFVNHYKAMTFREHGFPMRLPVSKEIHDAIINRVKGDLSFQRRAIAGIEYKIVDYKMSVVAFYSNMMTYSLPISVNLAHNSILKVIAGNEYEIITTTNAINPEKSYSSMLLNNILLPYVRVFPYCVLIIIIMAYFIVHPATEQYIGFKHIQQTCGLSPIQYWLPIFVFDFIVFMLITAIGLGLIDLMDSTLGMGIFHARDIMLLGLLLVLFAISALPMMYLFTLLKKSPGTMFVIASLVPITLLTLDLIFVSLIEQLELPSERTAMKQVERLAYYFLPHWAFFYGNIHLIDGARRNSQCQIECSTSDCCSTFIPFSSEDYPEEESLKSCITAFIFQCVFYFYLLYLIEYRFVARAIAKLQGHHLNAVMEPVQNPESLNRNRSMANTAPLVVKESSDAFEEIRNWDTNKEDVLSTGFDMDYLIRQLRTENMYVCYGLWKTKHYDEIEIVRNVSFRVQRNECFAIVGWNGVGKTTLLRFASSVEMPTRGTMRLWGSGNKGRHRLRYLSHLGYSPQKHALMNELSAFEHLYLCALARGIPKATAEARVRQWLIRFDLEDVSVIDAGNYDENYKRHLNIAMALIGGPTMVILDEPSYGMSPVARKLLWKTLSRCQVNGRSILVASNSMEEVMALKADRIAVMQNGEFIQLGTEQDYRQRYEIGFTVTVNLHLANDRSVEVLKDAIRNSFTARAVYESKTLVIFNIPNTELTWKLLFGTMEAIKSEHDILESYTITNGTMEDIFRQLTRASFNC